MIDLIVIAGAPGSGKSTICKILKETLGSPVITFGHLRGFHLNQRWTDMSAHEEEITFENFLYIVNNYIKHDYKNIIINDLENYRIEQIPEIYKDKKYAIFTLYINDDNELKDRVLDETRDSGFRDYKYAIKWNKEIKYRNLLPCEYLIDNTSKNYHKTIDEILKKIGKKN